LAFGSSVFPAFVGESRAEVGSRMTRALKSGILIPIVPPTLESVGMIFVDYKKQQSGSADR
jgi:hypothetical protein